MGVVDDLGSDVRTDGHTAMMHAQVTPITNHINAWFTSE